MFSAPLVLKEIGNELFEVVEPFRFTSATGHLVDVRAGFQTDLASIPEIFQSLVPKVGYYSQPAVVHDWLYHRHRTGVDTITSRREADKILLEACEIKSEMYEVSALSQKHHAIYSAVRLGGLASWETPGERRTRLDMHGDTEYMDQ